MKNIRVVKLPDSLDLKNTIKFSKDIVRLSPAAIFEFDFSSVGWFPPFSMLFLSQQLRRFRNERHKSKCRVTNYQSHSYAAHMGFFQSFGVNFGKAPGEALGSDTYIPIEEIQIESAFRNEAIEAHSRDLAIMLTRKETGDLVETVEYALREIIRNVVEHSQAQKISYCAQYWATKNLVEIGIIDAGIGIKKSISHNPHLNIETDRDALLCSLLPGISGKVYKGRRQRRRGVWENSGYGLYMTSRLCRNGGKFFICSGNSSLLLDRKDKKYYSADLQGTAIRLTINTEEIQSLSNQLQKFNKDGRNTALKLKGAQMIGPSVASQMLSKDFSNR